MYDLHLHSSASDGDYAPSEVVAEAARRGLRGVSLTDHNGLWGVDEAANAAASLGITFVEGIEITARYEGLDVHVLGYSKAFARDVLTGGLAETRDGYKQRLMDMTELCQAAGYEKVSWESIEGRRAHLENPAHVSFDLAIELMEQYGLSLEEARKLSVIGGKCHVPYGDWAMSPAAAIDLIHQADGIASLAHPGTIEREGDHETLEKLIAEGVAAGLDGIEIFHPFHSEEFTTWLESIREDKGLIATGGSDWHGQDHFKQNDARFGEIGVSTFPLL